MKIHRAIINPKTPADLLVKLPDAFLHSEIEIIAFPVEKEASTTKHSYESAVKFYKRHAVDFTKLEKWTREDLYE